jgi:hypothetical protein
MLLLVVVGLVGLLVFLTLIFSLDSDVTTGYYDRFGPDINKFFAGKVTGNLMNPLALKVLSSERDQAKSGLI